MITRQEYRALLETLYTKGYRRAYTALDDSGTSGVFFAHADGSCAAIRNGKIEMTGEVSP